MDVRTDRIISKQDFSMLCHGCVLAKQYGNRATCALVLILAHWFHPFRVGIFFEKDIAEELFFCFSLTEADVSWLPSSSTGLHFFALRPDVLQSIQDAPFEGACVQLETLFQKQGICCQCCLEPIERRCILCADACGWHRCLHRCHEEKLTLSDIDAYRWAPHSLYHLKGHDVEATVLQMLRHAAPPWPSCPC